MAKFNSSWPQSLVDDCIDTSVKQIEDAYEKISGNSSIGPQPHLDSLDVVELIVELEIVLDMKIPNSVIQTGGYDSSTEMRNHLIPQIRALWEEQKEGVNEESEEKESAIET